MAQKEEDEEATKKKKGLYTLKDLKKRLKNLWTVSTMMNELKKKKRWDVLIKIRLIIMLLNLLTSVHDCSLPLPLTAKYNTVSTNHF